MKLIGKLLMTVGIAIFTFIPPLADLATDTHVFHPDWLPHARMHTVWLLGVTSSMGLLALYLLWISKADSRFTENLAAMIGLCVYGSFHLSAATASAYGGALTDLAGGIENRILGVNANLFSFGLATAAILIGWWLCRREGGVR